MIQDFQAGDFLIFQVDSGFMLLRVLGVERRGEETIWHLAAYRDMYLDVDSAEEAAAVPDALEVEVPHVALTNRAFESTQVSRLGNVLLRDDELTAYQNWQANDPAEVSDRSIRLVLGLR